MFFSKTPWQNVLTYPVATLVKIVSLTSRGQCDHTQDENLGNLMRPRADTNTSYQDRFHGDRDLVRQTQYAVSYTYIKALIAGAGRLICDGGLAGTASRP